MNRNFDVSKPVQTRSGKPARIVDTDYKVGNGYTILAIVLESDREYAFSYLASGRFVGEDREDGLDLVNVPEVVETKLKLQCCECRVKSNGWMSFRADNNGYRWHFSPEETHEIFTALCRVQFDVFGDNSKQKENGNHSHE